MTDLIAQWWETIVGSTVVASALSWFGYTVKQVHRIDRDKADRSEIKAVMEKLDTSHNALLERIDKSNDAASQSRSKMHDKLDASIKAQNEFNIQVAQYMGRVNGRNDS